MVKHSYDYMAKKKERARIAQVFVKKFYGIAKKTRLKDLVCSYRRIPPDQVRFPVNFRSYSRDNTLFAIELDLPGTKAPLVYIIYVSVQEVRPLSPKQLIPKIRKIKELTEKYSRYSYDVRIGRYIICPAGFTGQTLVEELRRLKGIKSEYAKLVRKAFKYTAIGILWRHNIMPVRNEKKILENMAKYFKKRYNGLINSVRGKRIYGELVLLIYMISEIAKELGEQIPEDEFLTHTRYYGPLHAALNGIELSSITN